MRFARRQAGWSAGALRLLAALAAVAGMSTAAIGQEQKPAAASVRAELGKPIEAAIAALKQKNGKEVLARVAEADLIKDKTPYEAYVVERLRAQASVLLGDAPAAARAFEKASGSPAVPAAERLQIVAAAISQYYTAKDYTRTVELADRYFRDGGGEKSVRTLLVHSLFLGKDYARAAKEIAADIETDEKAGRVPGEELLQLLANSALNQRDHGGYGAALEKLLGLYPKRDYWLSALHGLQTRGNFPGRLSLDLARLKIATGTMRSTAEYVDAAQLSLQEGLPAEAVKIIDQGYAAKLLGTGADADRHKRLRTLAGKNLAEDRKALAQEDVQADSAKDGNLLFNAGFNHALGGSFDKGLDMMERALRKGGLKRLEDSRLRLGYAYYLAGRQQKAVDTFNAVRGNDGVGGLARLWAIHAGRKGAGPGAAAPRS